MIFLKMLIKLKKTLKNKSKTNYNKLKFQILFKKALKNMNKINKI